VKRIARILVITLLATLVSTVTTTVPAQAAPGKLTEDFTTSSLFNPNNWVATGTGSEVAHPCLTARDSSSAALSLSQGTNLPGCSTSPDSNGAGALYLTTNDNGQAATMLYNQALSTAGGLDISFYQAQYGGDGADGISFFVKDGSKTDLTVGKPGGNLGYKGIPGALFGIGFDSYGNWMNQGYYDGACKDSATSVANVLGGVPKALAVRGPDTSVNKDGTAGFCLLPGGFVAPNGAIGPEYFGKNLDTREIASRPVRILVDPSTNTNPKIRVYMWKSGSLSQDVSTAPIALTVDQPAEYKAAGTFKFGFSSSTGGAKDIHAIWGLDIAPLVPASSPTVYVVPNDVTVRAGDAAVYTYKFYSDAAKTVEIAANTLSYPQNICGSSYTLSTNYPATLPITCTGAVAMYNTITTATAILTVVRGTPSIEPAVNTITGNVGTPITSTVAYTARNFQYPQDLGYTIAPALPAGLSMNPTTGVISGTPTSLDAGTYTVTAKSLAETATAIVKINVAEQLSFAYSITYDKGAGTAGTLAAQTGSAKTVTLSAFSTSTMVNPGYTFSGWLGSNGTSYTDAQSLTFTGDFTVTLTAQWSANPSRTITYNAGTGTGTVPTHSDVLQGETFLVADGTGLTKAGYTFAGWKDDTETAYAAGATYTTGSTNVILTAQWSATSQSVTYLVNGGIGGFPLQANVPTGASFTVATASGLTKAGYTFAGWKDGAETNYAAGATYTMGSTNVIFTAQWLINSYVYAIAFEANGGTGVMSGLTGSGSSITLSPNTFTRTGYSFLGWRDDASMTYVDGQTLILVSTTALALHAMWLADKPAPPNDPVLVPDDKIISISPKSGFANDQITITGEFNRTITSVSVGGVLLAANSWTQTKTTVIFMAPSHDAGKVDIKLINGFSPELATQQFEYLKLADIKIGIDNIKCLGTFDKACSLKPGAVQPVSFQLASNALSAKSIKTLKSWKLQNAKQVVVYGYASPEGSKALNDKLTKKRAAEVGAWLKKTWPNLSIKTMGLGTTYNRLCKPFKNRCAMIKVVTIKK